MDKRFGTKASRGWRKVKKEVTVWMKRAYRAVPKK